MHFAYILNLQEYEEQMKIVADLELKLYRANQQITKLMRDNYAKDAELRFYRNKNNSPLSNVNQQVQEQIKEIQLKEIQASSPKTNEDQDETLVESDTPKAEPLSRARTRPTKKARLDDKPSPPLSSK